MIPRNIHQIWIGPNKIPDKCIPYINQWERESFGFNYFLWNEENLPKLPEKSQIQYERYGKIGKYAFQADIIRYFLLEKFGGIYIDIDFEKMGDIEPLLDNRFFSASPSEKVDWVCNSFIGSEVNHPLMKMINSELTDMPYHGPIFLADQIKRFLNLPKTSTAFELQNQNVDSSVRIYPSCMFFGYKPKIAKHHALKSWLPNKL